MSWIAPRIGLIALAFVIIYAGAALVRHFDLTGMAKYTAVGLSVAVAVRVAVKLAKRLGLKP